MKRVLLGTTVVVALVVVAGGVYYRAKSKVLSSSVVAPEVVVSPKPVSSPALLEGGNAIEVKDQSTDNLTVKINFASLDKPGFVVIHSSTKDSKPGEVIGHTDLLEPGQHDNLEVSIDEDVTLKKGDIIFAMLHADGNGDKVYTTADEDQPLKDDKGGVVVMKFTVTSTNSGSDSSSEE